MRFMAMHKANASTEAGIPPTPELMAEMGKLVGGGFQSGKILAAEGLQATSKRVRLTFSGGECQVTKGPLVGAGEVMSGLALVKVKSQGEAIGWAKRFAAIVGDIEIEIGPIHEPWDIGMMPKPEGAPSRFLMTHKHTKSSSVPAAPSPKRMAEMGKLIEEMKKAGVLELTEGLAPSTEGARVQYKGGKRTVIDGPFAESKELIAGFVMIRADSKEEVVEWLKDFATIIGDVEIDVRLVMERG